jgi:hypothetical protein
MFHLIPLVGRAGQGRFAVIDEADLERVGPHRWSLLVPNPACPHGAYAQSWIADEDGSKRRLTLHRFLMDAAPGQLVDHINGDGLDNRRCNLRLVTREQNQRNRRGRNGRAHKGITQTLSGRWRARIEVEGRSRHLGVFPTPEAASSAYHAAEVGLFGPYAFYAGLHAPQRGLSRGKVCG